MRKAHVFLGPIWDNRAFTLVFCSNSMFLVVDLTTTPSGWTTLDVFSITFLPSGSTVAYMVVSVNGVWPQSIVVIVARTLCFWVLLVVIDNTPTCPALEVAPMSHWCRTRVFHLILPSLFLPLLVVCTSFSLVFCISHRCCALHLLLCGFRRHSALFLSIWSGGKREVEMQCFLWLLYCIGAGFEVVQTLVQIIGMGI